MTEEPPLRSKPVTYDADDIIALSKLVPRTPVHIFRIAAGSIVILLMLLVVAEAYALTGMVDWPAIVACLFVAGMVLMLTNRRFRANIWLKLQKRSALHDGHVFEIGPGALLIISPKARSEIPWTTFIDMKVADSRLFLFMSKRLAYVIPRRAFDSDREFEAFTAAARGYWEQRHRL